MNTEQLNQNVNDKRGNYYNDKIGDNGDDNEDFMLIYFVKDESDSEPESKKDEYLYKTPEQKAMDDNDDNNDEEIEEQKQKELDEMEQKETDKIIANLIINLANKKKMVSELNTLSHSKNKIVETPALNEKKKANAKATTLNEKGKIIINKIDEFIESILAFKGPFNNEKKRLFIKLYKYLNQPNVITFIKTSCPADKTRVLNKSKEFINSLIKDEKINNKAGINVLHLMYLLNKNIYLLEK